MASKRKNPVAKVGNYRAEVDTVGIDPAMKDTMKGETMKNPLADLLKKFGKRKEKK